MAVMRIHAPEIRAHSDQLTVSARIETPADSREIFFRGPRDALGLTGADPFVITCMPWAMRRGLALEVDGEVSPQLLRNLEFVQDILCKWHGDFHRISVTAGKSASATPLPRAGTAAFFSGGVDSFYTALKHREEISSLLLVHGFDIELENAALRALVSDRIGRAAAALGKPLIEIETNGRSLTDPHVRWDIHQFGPALAGVAVAASGLAGRILIPASESYDHLDPCGSHPLLDPLWGTERAVLVHDGAEASRIEKVRAIAGFDAALELLRVCWENPEGAYNCGRCEKCVRTMLNLKAAGALDRCSAFDAPLDLESVSRVEIPMDLMAYHFVDNLKVLTDQGGEPELIRAMQDALARYEDRKLADAIEKSSARTVLGALIRGRLRRLAGRVGKRLASWGW
jgi:7-cyano-7-deazaguanine synthase in queuosine biosynthesis